jgi:chemotaxis protein methyltransferase CheR
VQPLLDEGVSIEELVARAERDDARVRHRITQAVPVGESYFFRLPEHFKYVRETLARRWAAEPGRTWSIWSAGCAAGEEAYSLAAVLRAAGVASFEIVGTDLVEANVAAARSGSFGPWSVRGGVALLDDPFVPASEPGVREVRPELRARTRFSVHNLLDAPPEPARFDLIFCRNVLIYFTPEAASRACASLASALAPGGVIAFATMDVAAAPGGLTRVGAHELQLFQRPPLGAAASAPARAARPAPPRPAAATPPRSNQPARARPSGGARATRSGAPGPAIEPVALHLSALAHIERGEHARARALLIQLQRQAPSYLPGMLEEALMCAREGRRGNALELMRSILERALALPAEQPIPGPETLPASFYAAAAQSFLGAEVRR